MTVDGAIADRLRADPKVAALVGARVYRLKLPPKSLLPAIRVQHISRVEFEGHLRGRAGLFRSRIQVDAFATEYVGINTVPAGTEDLVMAIDDALVAQAFDSRDSASSVRIWFIAQSNAIEESEPNELREVNGQQDYFVFWSRL